MTEKSTVLHAAIGTQGDMQGGVYTTEPQQEAIVESKTLI